MKIKNSMVFDLDLKMKIKKVVNLSQLSLVTDIPMKLIHGIYWNEVKTVPDGQMKKLCNFFECDVHELLSGHTVEEIEMRRRWYKKTAFLKDEGVIYFFEASGGEFGGLTKIGFTSDALTRIKTLKHELKCELTPKLYIPSNDVINLERLIHRIFSDKRAKGEWFRLEENDYELFEENKKADVGASDSQKYIFQY